MCIFEVEENSTQQFVESNSHFDDPPFLIVLRIKKGPKMVWEEN
jgi:hypothetical protein